AAIAAAKQKKRVAITDRRRSIGGAPPPTRARTRKTLPAALVLRSRFGQRAFYGRGYTVKDRITVKDLAFRVQAVLKRELEVVRAQLKRNRVDVLEGAAHFSDPHTVEIDTKEGIVHAGADYVLIACGTRPTTHPHIRLDGLRVFDSDQLLSVADREIPRNAVVVGGGVIGLEYASMFAALNTEVTIIDGRQRLLDFVDHERSEEQT